MSSLMLRWNGRVAVVTGASGAIGSKITEMLLDNGMKVVGMARGIEEMQKLKIQFAGKMGRFYPHKVDLTKEDEIKAAFKESSKVGPVSLLVNCAGVVIKSSLMDGPIDAWRQIWETNVLGLSIATMEAIKIMKANDIKGHIVHMNSTHGHTIIPSSITSFFGPGKFAITNLTEQLRHEFNQSKTEIKVTSISPGIVDSKFSGNMGDDVSKYLEDSPKLNPEDVADAIIYAISRPPHVQIHELIIKPVGEVL